MTSKTPACIGIIMDGNRRWARERNLPTLEGHKEGLGNFDRIARAVRDRGVKHLAIYALSIENWNRSSEEVGYLLELFRTAINDAFERIKNEGAQLHFVGDLSRFPKDLQEQFAQLEEDSKVNDDFHVWICASYGGRLEILEAARKLQESGEEVTEASLCARMWTANMPDPDIIIRTSGEQRLSGFLLWQSAYAELFFTKTYWPAFSAEELDAILDAYEQRERRHGK